mmetsp:Transcript_26285/g.39414  ORF Transcript_26285/g.39414 Transcript_26285/m.39414 type:complete len:310 (+) Transcript_26285:83-1012(+)
MMSKNNGVDTSKRPSDTECGNPGQTKKTRREEAALVESTGGANSDALESDKSDKVVLDIADAIGLTQPNIRIEVRWDLSYDVDDNGADDGHRVATSTDNKESGDKSVTKVWWGGILQKADDRTYKIQDGNDEVTVPIHSIDYDPYPPEFPNRSTEDVCFLSNHSLLNIESNTKTCWRLMGSTWEPSTDDDAEGEASHESCQLEGREEEDDEISVTSTSEEEGLRTVLDNVLKLALQSSGVMEKMKTMERTQQSIMADKIARTKENLISKLLEKLNENNDENSHNTNGVGRVVTPELIKTVMSELGNELS